MTAPTPHRRCNDFARARDARVRWLLATHPVTAAMLVRLGWFPTRNKALRRLNRLTTRRQIRFVGTVRRPVGRPEYAFCRWQPKADQLLHEVELTELCLRIDASRIDRGPHVADTRVRPDAEAWIDGRVYYLELDRGTTGADRIARDRFAKYEGCPHFSLWVCPTAARRDALRTRAAALRHTALFATLAEVLATPHGRVWRDHAGESAALPRESASSPADPTAA